MIDLDPTRAQELLNAEGVETRLAQSWFGKDESSSVSEQRGTSALESITLASEAASVGTARRFVRQFLNERKLDTAIAELLTSELVSNVIRHTGSEIAVMLAFDGRLRVEVHDGEAATEAFREILKAPATPADVPLSSPGRRGLPLVKHLASRFGLADEPGVWNGKIVWFEIDATALQ